MACMDAGQRRDFEAANLKSETGGHVIQAGSLEAFRVCQSATTQYYLLGIICIHGF